jgi:hypothetical protein
MDVLNLLSELRFQAKYEEGKKLADKLIHFISYQNEEKEKDATDVNNIGRSTSKSEAEFNPSDHDVPADHDVPTPVVFPNDRTIFMLKTNVDYFKKILKELTLISFYVEKDNTYGQLYYDIFWMIFNEKYTNDMEYYLNQLIFNKTFSVGSKVPYIQLLQKEESNLPKFPHNPSVLEFYLSDIENYYIINIRLSNTYQVNGVFVNFPTDKHIKTENILVITRKNEEGILEYVRSFNVKAKESNLEENPEYQYSGIEDIRLFWNVRKNKKVLSFVAHLPNEKNGKSYCYGYFPSFVKEDLSILFLETETLEYNLEVWPTLFAGRSEKNISKIEGDSLEFLYSTNPMISCVWPGEKRSSEKCDSEKCDSEKCDSEKCNSEKCDSEKCNSEKCNSEKRSSEKCDRGINNYITNMGNKDYCNSKKLRLSSLELSEKDQKYIQCDNRGSTALIKFYNKYLTIFHSHIEKKNTRLYIYRFVLFNKTDSKWEIESYSKWFYISLKNVDFINSMEKYGDNHLIIGYGQDDHVDMYGVIENSKVLEMLETNKKVPNIKIIEFK